MIQSEPIVKALQRLSISKRTYNPFPGKRTNQDCHQYSCSGEPGNWMMRKQQGNQEKTPNQLDPKAGQTTLQGEQPSASSSPPPRPRDIKSGGLGGGGNYGKWKCAPAQSSPFGLITGPTSRTLLSSAHFSPLPS